MFEEEKPSAPNGVSPFERIRRTNAAGAEYWSSRDFAQVLGYADYRNFEQVIKRAKTACFNSGQRVEDHFVDITEMIESATIPESLPFNGSMELLQSRKRKQPRILKQSTQPSRPVRRKWQSVQIRPTRCPGDGQRTDKQVGKGGHE